MNRYIFLVAVIFLQIASSFSGPIDSKFGTSHVVKRADDLLTNEIDLSLNDIDNVEAQKRLRVVQRQAETNNAQPSSHSNSTLCDVIGSFVAQGANSLSSIITNMTKILQQLCTSATQAFLHPGQSTSTNSS